MNEYSLTGFLRLENILGNQKKGIPAIIPVSKSTWWLGVKEGRFPKPIRLSARTVAWPVGAVRALVASFQSGTTEEGK